MDCKGKKIFESLKGDLKEVALCENGKKLSSLELNDHKTSLFMRKFKAHEKGKGYGKKLLSCIFDSKPELVHITTDGFTDRGLKAFSEVAEKRNFVVTERRYTFSGPGVGQAFRQDFIDKIIEMREKGIRTPWYFDSSLHSKNKK